MAHPATFHEAFDKSEDCPHCLEATAKAIFHDLVSARSRIPELEDTVRYERAAPHRGGGDRTGDDARRVLSAIATRRGPDWTGADVGEEPTP